MTLVSGWVEIVFVIDSRVVCLGEGNWHWNQYGFKVIIIRARLGENC